MSTSDLALDRADILETVTWYFMAIDRRDFAALHHVFTPDIEAVFEGVHVAGGIDRLIAFVTGKSDVSLPVDVVDLQLSMHFIGNHVATIEGDRARTETYALAHLVDRPSGVPRMRTRGLRYVDALVRTPDGWRIAKREHLCDWMRDDSFLWAAPGVVASRLVEPPS
ncbi:MAG: nuclear transport factor 2 family protein [Acidimicrobiales bacterium]